MFPNRWDIQLCNLTLKDHRGLWVRRETAEGVHIHAPEQLGHSAASLISREYILNYMKRAWKFSSIFHLTRLYSQLHETS